MNVSNRINTGSAGDQFILADGSYGGAALPAGITLKNNMGMWAATQAALVPISNTWYPTLGSVINDALMQRLTGNSKAVAPRDINARTILNFPRGSGGIATCIDGNGDVGVSGCQLVDLYISGGVGDTTQCHQFRSGRAVSQLFGANIRRCKIQYADTNCVGNFDANLQDCVLGGPTTADSGTTGRDCDAAALKTVRPFVGGGSFTGVYERVWFQNDWQGFWNDRATTNITLRNFLVTDMLNSGIHREVSYRYYTVQNGLIWQTNQNNFAASGGIRVVSSYQGAISYVDFRGNGNRAIIFRHDGRWNAAGLTSDPGWAITDWDVGFVRLNGGTIGYTNYAGAPTIPVDSTGKVRVNVHDLLPAIAP